MQRAQSNKILRHEQAKDKYKQFEAKKVDSKSGIKSAMGLRVPKPGQFFVLTMSKETEQPRQNIGRPKTANRIQSASTKQFVPNVFADNRNYQNVCAVTKNINVISANRFSASPSYRVIPDLLMHYKYKKADTLTDNIGGRPISGHILKKMQNENIESIYESEYLNEAFQFDQKMSSATNKKLPSFIVKPRKGAIKYARGYNTVVLKDKDIQHRFSRIISETDQNQSQPRQGRKRLTLNIDRLKNNSNIKEIEAKISKITPSFLPVDYYLFDDLSPQQLLSKYKVSNTVLGLSKWFLMDGSYQWKTCQIIKYDSDTQRWLIRWQHNNAQKAVSRSNLRFKEESEEEFSLMMQKAECHRNRSEVYLKYNFIIDLMKTSTSTLPQQFQSVVESFARGYSFKLYKVRDPIQFSKLSFENQFKQSYRPKVLNLSQSFSKSYQESIFIITFERLLKQISEHYIRANHQIQFNSILPFSEEYQTIFKGYLPKRLFQPVIEAVSAETSSKGCVSVYETNKKGTYQKTILKIRQISHIANSIRLKTLSNLKRSELDLEKECFFLQCYKSFALEDLSNNWDIAINDLSVKINCRSNDSQHDIGSQLDILYLDRCAETQAEYQRLVAQVTRFLWMINHRYEMVVRNIYEKSIQHISQKINSALQLFNTNEITFESVNQYQHKMDFFPFVDGDLRIQIAFRIEKEILIVEPSLEKCRQLFISKKKQMMKVVCEIPCIEKSYLPRPRQRKYMKIFESEQELESLDKMYNQSVNQACKCFQVFEHKIAIMVQKIFDYANNESKKVLKKKTYSEFQFELRTLQQYLLEIQSIFLPRKVHTAIFLFDCREIRQKLISKIYEISVEIYKYLIERIKKQNEKIAKMIEGIIEKLQTQPSDIESMFQLAKYAQEDVNLELESIYLKINEVMGKMDLLAEMNYKIDYESFEKSWEIYSVPLSVKNKQTKCLKMIETNYKKLFSQQLVLQKSNLSKEISGINQQLQDYMKYNSIKQIDVAASKFMELNQRIEKALDEAKIVDSREVLFNVKQSDFSQLYNIKNNSRGYYQVWVLGKNYTLSIHNLVFLGPLHTIDKKMVTNQVNDACQQLERLETQTFSEDPKMLEVTKHIHKKYTDFQKYLPLLHSLKNTDLRQRHISAINELLGTSLTEAMSATLSSVIVAGGLDFAQQIVALSETASNEHILEKSFNKLKKEWRQVKLKLVTQEANIQIKVISELQNIQSRLDSDIIKIQNMLSSPYCSYFEQEILGWRSQTIYKVQQVLDLLAKAQKISLTFQSFFSNSTQNQQLSKESVMHKSFDKMWKALLHQINCQPCVIDLIQTKMKENLIFMIQILEQIRKGLSQFFNSKREEFKHFYFVSNEDMLDIYSKCGHPINMKYSVKKCFPEIDDLEMTDQGLVTAMYSGGNKWVLQETINLGQNQMPERWFQLIETGITNQLKNEINLALACPNNYSYQLQALLMAQHLKWTNSMDNAISTCNFNVLLDQQITDTSQIFFLTADHFKEACVVQLKNYLRDITSNIVKQCINQTALFYWQIQIRHSLQQSVCCISIMNIKKYYGYEYFGNQERLFLCPPTIKALTSLYVTLDQSTYGCAIGKPSGGKSSTISELSKMVGRRLITVDCRDNVGVGNVIKAMQSVFSAGNWLKIERVQELLEKHEVISILCQCLQQLKIVMLNKKNNTLLIGDKQIKVNHEAAVFLTSLDIKYQQIPQSLRLILRPTAVLLPDFQQVLQWMLQSSGFRKAKQIVSKLKTLFLDRLSLLSAKFKHYDSSFYSAKMMCKYMIRQHSLNPTMDEFECLFFAFELFVKNSLEQQDKIGYLNFIDRYFPTEFESNVQKGAQDGKLQAALSQLYEKQNMTLADQFRSNLITMAQLADIYKGIVVVGNANTGKSTGIKMLVKALNSLNKEIQLTTIFPKSLASQYLYGKVINNQILTHGYFPKILRELNQTKQNWIVLDSQLDPHWSSGIHHYFSNQTDTFQSDYEQQKYPQNTRLLIETPALIHACPKTIVSCGKVYFNEKLSWQLLLNIWINNSSKQVDYSNFTTLFKDLFKHILTPLVNFYSSFSQTKQKLLEGNQYLLVQTVLRVLDSVIMKPKKIRSYNQSSKSLINSQQVVTSTLTDARIFSSFIYSVIWGIGSYLNSQGRTKFSKLIKTILSKQLSNSFSNIENISFPEQNQLFSSFYDGVQWKKWDSQQFKPSSIAPTPTLVCQFQLFQKLMQQEYSVALAGSMGSGRTTSLKYFTAGLNSSYLITKTTMHHNLSLSQYTNILETNIQKQKKRRGIASPQLGKTNIIVIDDIHLEAIDEYSNRNGSEILRSWFCEKGWVDTKTVEFKKIQNILFFVSCNNFKDPEIDRLLRHFTVLMTSKTDEDIATIFNQILYHSKLNVNQEMPFLLASIVKITLNLNSIMAQTNQAIKKKLKVADIISTFRTIQEIPKSQYAKKQDVRFSLLQIWISQMQNLYSPFIMSDSTHQLQSIIAPILKEQYDVIYSDLKMSEQTVYSSAVSGTIQKVLLNEMVRILKQIPLSNVPQDLLTFQFASRICQLANILTLGNYHCLVQCTRSLNIQFCLQIIPAFKAFCIFELTYQQPWITELKKIIKFSIKKPTILHLDISKTASNTLYDLFCFVKLGTFLTVFKQQERQQIILDCHQMDEWESLMVKVRKNLKIVIQINPYDPDYERIIKQYPAARFELNTISLIKAQQRLGVLDGTDNQLTTLRQIHEINGQMQAIPVSVYQFQQFKALYYKIHSNRRRQLLSKRQQYTLSIINLNLAAAEKQQLQIELSKYQQILNTKKEMLEQLTKKREQQFIIKAQISKDLTELNKFYTIKSSIKQDLEKQYMSKLEPLILDVEESKRALKQIEHKQIKSTNISKMVLQMLLIVFDKKSKQEDPIKALAAIVGQSKFIKKIDSVNVNHFSDKIYSKLKELFAKYGKDLTHVQRQNLTCRSILRFIKTVYQYLCSLRQAQPLKAKLNQITKIYEGVKTQKQTKVQYQKRTEQLIENLNSNFKSLVGEHDKLQGLTTQTGLCLSNVENISKGFKVEVDQWRLQSSIIDNILANTEGDSIIFAATAVYLADKSQSNRFSTVEQYKKILNTKNIQFSQMSSIPMQSNHYFCGNQLTKNFSKNMLIWKTLNKHSLLIDSECLIEKIFRSLTVDSKKSMIFLPKHLVNEDNIQNVQYVVTVQNSYNLSSNIQSYMKSTKSPKLIIICQNSSIQHSLKVDKASVAVINFSSNPDSIKQAITEIVLHSEEPLVEEEMKKCSIQKQQIQQQLKKLRQFSTGIFSSISQWKSLLKSQSRVDSLLTTLSTVEHLRSKIREIKHIEERFAKNLNNYQHLSNMSYHLYQICKELKKIDNSYEIGFDIFVNGIGISIKEAEKPIQKNLMGRLSNIEISLKRVIYRVLHGMVKKQHKQGVCLKYLLSLNLYQNVIDDNLVEFLLNQEKVDYRTRGTFEINTHLENALLAISKFKSLDSLNIISKMKQSPQDWTKYFNQLDCTLKDPPGCYNVAKLAVFTLHKLLNPHIWTDSIPYLIKSAFNIDFQSNIPLISWTKHINPMSPLICIENSAAPIVQEIKRVAADIGTSVIDQWMINVSEQRMMHLMKDPKWLILYSNENQNELDKFESFIDRCRKNEIKIYSSEFRIFLIVHKLQALPLSYRLKYFTYYPNPHYTLRQSVSLYFTGKYLTKIQKKLYENQIEHPIHERKVILVLSKILGLLKCRSDLLSQSSIATKQLKIMFKMYKGTFNQQKVDLETAIDIFLLILKDLYGDAINFEVFSKLVSIPFALSFTQQNSLPTKKQFEHYQNILCWIANIKQNLQLSNVSGETIRNLRSEKIKYLKSILETMNERKESKQQSFLLMEQLKSKIPKCVNTKQLSSLVEKYVLDQFAKVINLTNLMECTTLNNTVQNLERTFLLIDANGNYQNRYSLTLEIIQKQLKINKIPFSWAKSVYPSSISCLSLLQNISQHVQAMKEKIALSRSINLVFNPAGFTYPIVYINCWLALYNMNSKGLLNVQGLKLKATIVQDLQENFSKQVHSTDDINKLSNFYLKGLVIRNGSWDSLKKCVKQSTGDEYLIPFLRLTVVDIAQQGPEQKEDRKMHFQIKRRDEPIIRIQLPCQNKQKLILEGCRIELKQ